MKRVVDAVASKRQAFRQIQPEKKMLDYLDKIGLGTPSDKVTRKVVAIKRRQYGLKINRASPSKYPLLENEESPHPFNRGPKSVNPVQKIIQIDKFEDLPDYGGVPEVAVIGRSNVGKSTLLNSLLGFTSHVQKAKVSDKPGETKMLQFFCIGSYNNKKSKPKLAVVDMPGYGFSYMSEKVAESVTNLTRDYICDRGPVLKRILLLLDARHGFKLADTEYMNQLIAHANTRNKKRPSWKLQVVLTKCDMVPRHDLARRVVLVRDHINEKLHGLALSNLPVVTVSGLERRGIVQLQRELAALVPAPPAPKVTSPVPSSQSEASLVEEASVVNESMDKKDDANSMKVNKIGESVKKKSTAASTATSQTPDKASTDMVTEEAIMLNNGREIQSVKRGLDRVEKGDGQIEGIKLAVGLKPKKSIITRPVMDEYLSSLAPIADGDTISLTMSDRLDAILDHHFAKLEKMKVRDVKNEEPESSDRNHMKGSISSMDELPPSVIGRFEIDTSEEMRMNQKTGLFTRPVSTNASNPVFKKKLSVDELQQKIEKKNKYKSRYGGKTR